MTFTSASQPKSPRSRSAKRTMARALLGLCGLAALPFFTTAGGCSSSATKNPPVAVADFPTAYADALCGPAATCCAALGGTFDPAKCRDAASQESRYLNNAPPGSTYDAQAAGDCVAQVSAQYGSCPASLLAPPSNTDRCQLYTGTAKLGESCANKLCARTSEKGPLMCEPYTGVCTAVVVAATGAPCCVALPYGNTTCRNEQGGVLPLCSNTSSFCDPNSLVCVAPLNDGVTCDPRYGASAPCRSGSYCSVQPTGPALCAPLPGAGAPCAQGGCASGLSCDQASKTCTTPLAYGAPCDGSTTGGGCGNGLRCSNGTCRLAYGGPPGCTL